MEENVVKRVMKIKRKPKKKIMKIKRKPQTHKIKIYCAKKFYEQYLKENEKPIDMMGKIKFDLSQIEHLFKYNPENISKEDLTKILNTNVDINMILGVIFGHSQGKLDSLGIGPTSIVILEKLYYLLTKVIKEFGMDEKYMYGPDDIRFKLTIMKRGHQPKLKLKSMYAIKDGIIIETSELIKPDNILKGSKIMVEYDDNKFINIPYMAYKKLFEIDYLSIDLKVAEDQDLSYDKNSEDCYILQSDTFLYLNRKFESDGIYTHLYNIMRYINLWDAFDQLTIELGSPYIPYRENIEVHSKGKKDIYDVAHFLTEFFEFL